MRRVLILFKQEKLNQMCRIADFLHHPITPSVTIDFEKNYVENWNWLFFFFTTIKLVHLLPLCFTGTLSWHLNVKWEGLNTKGSSLQNKKQINLKNRSHRELWDTLQTLTCFQQFTHPASLAEFNGLNYSSHLIHSSQHTLIGGVLLNREQVLFYFPIKRRTNYNKNGEC